MRRMTRPPFGPGQLRLRLPGNCRSRSVPRKAPAVRSIPGRRSSARLPFTGPLPWQVGRRNGLLGAARGGGGGVLLAELVHAARGVDDLLLAGIERMAVRATLDLHIMSEGRARLYRITARAGDGDLFVLGMDGGFHGVLTVASEKTLTNKWGVKHTVKGRGGLAAGSRAFKPLECPRRFRGFLIHRSCGQLCGRRPPRGYDHAVRLHICYLGQKMSIAF